ncbi:MAG: MFS transporter [Acidimicrobiia bacterium]
MSRERNPGRLRRNLFVDVGPLRRSRDFRFLYAGQLVSLLGRQFAVVAVPYQVFLITGTSLAVGLVGLVQLGPLLAMSLIGGAFADAVDRRRLLLVAQLLQGVVSVGLALYAQGGGSAVWPIYVLVAVAAGLSGLSSPTWSAVLPALVGRRDLPAAFALNQILFQLGQAVGPAVAGLVIARVSLAAAYWIDAASFGVAAASLIPIRPLPPQGGGRRAGPISILEGLRFLRDRRLLQATFAIDISAMVFGMPRALFPELGTRVFGGDARTVGLLFAAPGVGALLGASTSGWVGGVRRQGRAVLVAVLVWGLAITGFGVAPWLLVALALLAVAGAADVISAIFRSTILQVSVPDALRGRLTGVHTAVVTGGPRLGDAEAGTVAALTTPRISVVSGGLLSILGALLINRLFPELRSYHRDADDGEARRT